MALSVQNDDGDVEDAVAYVSVTDFKAYHTLRGNSLTEYTDAAIETAIVRATDYLDGRFRYVGQKANGFEQATEWPRIEAYYRNYESIVGVPKAVLDATCEYGFRALSAALVPDPSRGATGGVVKSMSEKVEGAVERSVTYADGSERFTMPEYPAADAKLCMAGLVRSARTGNVRRA